MIGLPLPRTENEGIKNEEEEIVDFIADIGRRTRMSFNINIGIFIPKPHTPYQRSIQIDSVQAVKKLEFIRSKLKPAGHKVSVSEPLISTIEGLLSRGDERAGLLCEQAFFQGSRLDAWSEYINRDIWQKLIEDNQTLLDTFSGTQNLPWNVIDSCITYEFFKTENEKSQKSLTTAACTEKCSSCGVCGKNIKIVKNENVVNYDKKEVNINTEHGKSDPSIYRILFSFSKNKTAVFHGHLSLIEIFSLTFRRAGIPVMYTKGFNPLAKMEFASPLSTGINADCEFASVDFPVEFDAGRFIENMNKYSPKDLLITNAECFCIHGGMKKHSLSSLLWGFAYLNTENKIDYVNVSREKVYRNEMLKNRPNQKEALFSLRRKEVLANNITDTRETDWISYFSAYRFLYRN